MKDKNKISNEELNEFFSEVEKTKEANTIKEKVIEKYTCKCPKCGKVLNNRKDPCPYCNYKGYIPMGDAQIKKIRKIMFIIILAIALVLLIIRKML